jgi:hypothetical protein
MTDLSPAAQAVWHAYETANCDPYFIDPRQAGVAAALQAAADQVVPEEPLNGGDQRWMFERDARQASRKKLLAIAAELEAMP